MIFPHRSSRRENSRRLIWHCCELIRKSFQSSFGCAECRSVISSCCQEPQYWLPHRKMLCVRAWYRPPSCPVICERNFPQISKTWQTPEIQVRASLMREENVCSVL